MAPHFSALAWKIPWTEESGGLQSMRSLRVGHNLSDFTFTFHFHALENEMATHSSVLAWRIPGTEEPSGLPSVGLHRVGHDWSDLAAAAAVHLMDKLFFVPYPKITLYLGQGSSGVQHFRTLKVFLVPGTQVSMWLNVTGRIRRLREDQIH